MCPLENLTLFGKPVCFPPQPSSKWPQERSMAPEFPSKICSLDEIWHELSVPAQVIFLGAL